MKGNRIILSAHPKGVFLEGTVYGTPKPGTVMEVKSTAMVNGRATWQAWSKATGAVGLKAVLVEDDLQGKLYSDAYVTGTRCKLYVPMPGEELNVLVADVAGTADDVAIGDLLGVETTTGKAKLNSSYADPCWTAMEAKTDPAADFWLWSTFNG